MLSRFQSAIERTRAVIRAYVRDADVCPGNVTALDRAIKALSLAREARTIFELIDNIDTAFEEISRIPELQLEATPTGSKEPKVHIVRHGTATALCSGHMQDEWGSGHRWVRAEDADTLKDEPTACQLCLVKSRE